MYMQSKLVEKQQHNFGKILYFTQTDCTVLRSVSGNIGHFTKLYN